VSIEDEHAPARLTEHVVRVVRGVGIIQETEKKRDGRRVRGGGDSSEPGRLG
jgi:hypothetical protein